MVEIMMKVTAVSFEVMNLCKAERSSWQPCWPAQVLLVPLNWVGYCMLSTRQENLWHVCACVCACMCVHVHSSELPSPSHTNTQISSQGKVTLSCWLLQRRNSTLASWFKLCMLEIVSHVTDNIKFSTFGKLTQSHHCKREFSDFCIQATSCILRSTTEC